MTMAFASMHEGIFRCNGCGRTYLEYVNGCVEDHSPPRRVELVVPDEGYPERINEHGNVIDYGPQFGEEE